MNRICQELNDEYEALDSIVSVLDEAGWGTKTPFYDWTVQEEIAHIAFFDGAARLSATEPDTFEEHVKVPFNGQNKAWAQMLILQKMAYADLLKKWRDERTALIKALQNMDQKKRLPWYGPPMSALSFATARLMETWAHGQDIADAFGISRIDTDRLYHIAHLGNITLGWSFANRQMAIPQTPIRVELTSPSGKLWTWGRQDALDTVRGSAVGFCLVVTQRRHYADTDLVITGEAAEKWMSLAQCFAGPPEMGPEPGKFFKKEGTPNSFSQKGKRENS